MTEIVRSTVHEQIADILRPEILSSYQPGQRFPSQNVLAVRFQASPNTVREAVGLLTQEGLLTRRQGSGTFVAKRPQRQWVAVLTELDIGHPSTSYYFRRIVQSLRQAFLQAPYPATLYIGHAPPTSGGSPDRLSCEEFYRDLAAGRIAGIAMVGTSMHLVEQALAGHRLPLVTDGGTAAAPLVDYPGMARQAARYLVTHGRRRLAFIEYGDGTAANPVRSAFVAEAASLGVAVPPGRLLGVYPGGRHPDGLAAFRALWQTDADKPDGLAVLDDVVYRGLCPALLYNRIRVPEELLIVSHAVTGDPQAFIPAPVRLEIDPELIARAMARNLLQAIGVDGAKAMPTGTFLRFIEPAGREWERALIS